jgi:hypothetical protein
LTYWALGYVHVREVLVDDLRSLSGRRDGDDLSTDLEDLLQGDGTVGTNISPHSRRLLHCCDVEPSNISGRMRSGGDSDMT